MRYLAWPVGFLSSSLHEHFISEFRSLLSFHSTEEPPCCMIPQIQHISDNCMQFSLLASHGGTSHATTTTTKTFVFAWMKLILRRNTFYLHLPDLVGRFHFIKTRSSPNKQWCCLGSEWPGTKHAPGDGRHWRSNLFPPGHLGWGGTPSQRAWFAFLQWQHCPEKHCLLGGKTIFSILTLLSFKQGLKAVLKKALRMLRVSRVIY